MPFAPHTCCVALRRQQLRDGDLPRRQPVRFAPDGYCMSAGADGEAARHERRPRWCAFCFDVEVEQASALSGERVNAWRGRAAKATAAVNAQFAKRG
jgi:hypothetical protein